MDLEISLPLSQVPATCPSPEPNKSGTLSLHPSSLGSILILSSYLRLDLPSGPFPSGFQPAPCVHLCSSRYVLHAPPMSFFPIWSPEKWWVTSTDHYAPHYVVFSTPLLPRSSYVQIISSTPYCQTPSTCVQTNLQPASGYHTTPAKPQRNTNTHRTRAIQPMKELNK